MSYMAKKTTTSFNVDNSTDRITKPSVFDRIVKEIDANEIPSKYIDQIRVQYHDGNVVELKGKELTHPIPVNTDASWEIMENEFKKMKEVKIFISTDQLETDINILVEKYLGKLC